VASPRSPRASTTRTGGPVENPSGYIVDTLRAVCQCLFSEEGFESVLLVVVNRGGDADTTGAIAGVLAGAVYGADAVALRWLRALNPRIRAQCEQARQLLRLAPNQHR